MIPVWPSRRRACAFTRGESVMIHTRPLAIVSAKEQTSLSGERDALGRQASKRCDCLDLRLCGHLEDRPAFALAGLFRVLERVVWLRIARLGRSRVVLLFRRRASPLPPVILDPGQLAHCLHAGHSLEFHMQLDDAAVHPAAKAVEAVLVREDREARGFFTVLRKRTQALVAVGGPVVLESPASRLAVFQQRIVANHRIPVRPLPLLIHG